MELRITVRVLGTLFYLAVALQAVIESMQQSSPLTKNFFR